MFILLSGIVVK